MAIGQHPIPQNVTAYEFHLIGNMTVKQFLELGGGIGIALIFYSTNLPDLVRWPLIAISILIGAALAFMPFDGRPLDRMVLIFIRAIYSPTQFIWKKTSLPPDFFNFKPKKPLQVNQTELEKRRVRKNLDEYLQTLPQKAIPTNSFDDYESKYLATINTLFDSSPTPTPPSPQTRQVTFRSSPKVRIRKIKDLADLNQASADVTHTNQAASMTIPQTVPVSLKKPATSPTPQPTQTPTLQSTPQPQSVVQAPAPQTQAVHAAHQKKDLPFPSLPTTPNTLVGMVLDGQGKIVENAIIEVRDNNHMPIRALKTNKLGQFFSATQLSNGDYEIEAEKDGLRFDIVSLKLDGKIVSPLEIRSST